MFVKSHFSLPSSLSGARKRSLAMPRQLAEGGWVAPRDAAPESPRLDFKKAQLQNSETTQPGAPAWRIDDQMSLALVVTGERLGIQKLLGQWHTRQAF